MRMWGVSDNPTLPGGYTARTVFQIFNGIPLVQLHSLAAGLQIWTWKMPTADDSGDVHDATHTVAWAGDAMQDGVTEQFVFRFVNGHGDGELQFWRNGVEQCNLTGIDVDYTGAADLTRTMLGLYRISGPNTIYAEYANFKFGTDLSAKVLAPDALPQDW